MEMAWRLALTTDSDTKGEESSDGLGQYNVLELSTYCEQVVLT